jgi:hypothetical protein
MKVREGNFLIDQIFKNKSTKGQLISKADWRIIDSPKKNEQTNLFCLLFFMANTSNLSVRFFGESTVRQSAFWFYLTFIRSKLPKKF